MKKDNNILFDDNETREDLLIKDMTPEEIDAEYERIFGKSKSEEQFRADKRDFNECLRVVPGRRNRR